MSDQPPLHCSCCGYRYVPDRPRPLERVLVLVTDEVGSQRVCDLCVMALIADLGPSGDVTLFVARSRVAAS